jgi:hypothetical protein
MSYFGIYSDCCDNIINKINELEVETYSCIRVNCKNNENFISEYDYNYKTFRNNICNNCVLYYEDDYNTNYKEFDKIIDVSKLSLCDYNTIIGVLLYYIRISNIDKSSLFPEGISNDYPDEYIKCARKIINKTALPTINELKETWGEDASLRFYAMKKERKLFMMQKLEPFYKIKGSYYDIHA